MADVRIDCINRDGPDADFRIDMLGGPQPNGEGRWKMSLDDVIKSIQSGEHNYWTHVGGVSAWVQVKKHPSSQRLYLATEADGYPPNNLLSLDECP
jgi:Protein of unknown function (DUF3892)